METNTVEGIMEFEVKLSKNRGKKCGIVCGTFGRLQTVFASMWGRIFSRKVKVVRFDDNITQGNIILEPQPAPKPTRELGPDYSEDDRIIDQLYEAIMENNPDFEVSVEFQKLCDALPPIDPELDDQIDEILKAYAEKDSVGDKTKRIQHNATD